MGVGFGWRWIFLFLISVSFYVVGGVYFNQRSEGKHGIEAIPHIHYWREVPSLVTDGLAFSYTHGKSAWEASITHGRSTYETMKGKYQGLHLLHQH